MKRRTLAVFVGGAAVALAVAAWPDDRAGDAMPADDSAEDERIDLRAQAEADASRQLAIAAAAPGLSPRERATLLDDSDRIRARFEAEGESDVGSALRTRLREIEVSKADARAWYDEHRPLFGERSFEQSRLSIERLIAIERVRDELEVEHDLP